MRQSNCARYRRTPNTMAEASRNPWHSSGREAASVSWCGIVGTRPEFLLTPDKGMGLAGRVLNSNKIVACQAELRRRAQTQLRSLELASRYTPDRCFGNRAAKVRDGDLTGQSLPIFRVGSFPGFVEIFRMRLARRSRRRRADLSSTLQRYISRTCWAAINEAIRLDKSGRGGAPEELV